MPDLANITASV